MDGLVEIMQASSRAPPPTPASSPEPTDLELGFEEPWQGDEPADEG